MPAPQIQYSKTEHTSERTVSFHIGAFRRKVAHNDEKLRETATAFEKEMGGLAKAFMAYKEDWMTPTKIKEAPEACLAATQKTIGALKKRLAREDKELYPLVEE